MQPSVPKVNDSAEEMVKARNAILAAIPIPPGAPEDMLQPIIIPAPFTLHEFLGNASGVSSFSHFVTEFVRTDNYPQSLRTS